MSSVKTAILILKDLFQPRTLYELFFYLTEMYELNDPHEEKQRVFEIIVKSKRVTFH